MNDFFNDLKQKGKDFFEETKERINNTTDIVPKELTRLNDTLDKILKDFDCFKQSMQVLKIIFIVIALLLLILIIVLIAD